MHIEAWFKNEDGDIGAVSSVVKPMLVRNGFLVNPRPGVPPTEQLVQEWVTLNGKSVYSHLSERTEGHVVFGLAFGGSPELAPRYLRLFRELLADRTLLLNECILSSSNLDVYPLLTHSFGGPIGLVKVREDDSIEETVEVGASNYWQEIGPKLHFVATRLFTHAGVAPIHAWSSRLRAPIIDSPLGPIFDCGWSQLFPTLSPLLSDLVS